MRRGEVQGPAVWLVAGCEQPYHLACEDLAPGDRDVVLEFYCMDCESKGKLSAWPGKEATRDQLRDKMKNYYEVDSIQRHKILSNGDRKFLVE